MIEPVLYIVPTPIGNKDDITNHAVNTLRNSSLIIGEEFKATSKLLKSLSISRDFELLNEHSTETDIYELFQKIQKTGVTSLVSDVGTPLIEDPGFLLVQMCIREGIKIKSLPGPSAFLVGLTLSGFSTVPFSFLGFLPIEWEAKKKIFQKYLSLKTTIVFYETPYRYKKTIQELSTIMDKNRKVFLGLDLTSENEFIFRGSLRELMECIDKFPKAPPVIIFDNSIY
jgi:16S rRNA (cytidine1402-2'-O)-methyltransferase